MKLYSRQWSRRELEARVGPMEQIGGLRRLQGREGPDNGVVKIQVRSGAELCNYVTPDKGMDISLAELGGTPIRWQSANGDMHPAYYDTQGREWLRTASGGLLMTCGLANVGSPCEDQGRSFGQHGRIHHLPARQVAAEGTWERDEYTMRVRGIVNEISIYGDHLRLTREIFMPLGENRIAITDAVESAGFKLCMHLILYHFNFGYPLINEYTSVKFPAEQ